MFDDVKEACAAAQDAFEQLKTKGIAGRAKVVEIVKALCTEKAAEWGKFEFEETKIGRLEHKIEKLQIVKLVPGVEWIKPYGLSGDHGITMEEHTPFGVVGAVLPVTHSVPTLSGNVINIVAAGNAVVFNPHPGGARSAALAVRTYNEAIFAALGIENLVCTVEKPSLESFDALTKNEFIRLLCITGGPAVVGAAMKSGKRAICAGPGNPPVLVDGTGCLKKAARDVLQRLASHQPGTQLAQCAFIGSRIPGIEQLCSYHAEHRITEKLEALVVGPGSAAMCERKFKKTRILECVADCATGPVGHSLHLLISTELVNLAVRYRLAKYGT